MSGVGRMAYRLLGRVPVRLRNLLVRWSSPRYSMAAIVLIRDETGRYLMVRPAYREWWGFPGGMVDAHELPEDCARREAREEIGVDVELVGEPVVIVDRHWRRVEFAWRARLAGGADPHRIRPGGAEIAEIAWRHPADPEGTGLHGSWLVEAVEEAAAQGRTTVAAPALEAAARGLLRRPPSR